MERRERLHEPFPPPAERREVAFVGRLDVLERAHHERAPGAGQPQPARPRVLGICGSLEQASPLEFAQHLAGHHLISSGLHGKACLGGRAVVVLGNPPQRRQQDELHVRQPVRVERGTNQALPGQSRAPEQEPRAPLRGAEPGSWPLRCYCERSLASWTSERIVSGKSAVISGPTSRACSDGPSISAM